MTLPLGNHNFYVGIDPGHKGAVAVMNASGTTVVVSTMPMADGEIDLGVLSGMFRHVSLLPGSFIGIEWPEAFPGSFGGNPRDNDRFGRQKGYLEALAYTSVGPERYARISPLAWKGRLGLDGKTIAGANERAAKLFETFYPERASLIRGSRGGLLDGPLDALLIAHYLRVRTGTGMKSIADKFGKDSVEAFAFVCGGGRRRRKLGHRLDGIQPG